MSVEIIARDDGPSAEERLEWERASRAVIRRIFESVMQDNWDAVYSLYRESRAHGEWFTVSVWAGLPNTVRARIREMESNP